MWETESGLNTKQTGGDGAQLSPITAEQNEYWLEQAKQLRADMERTIEESREFRRRLDDKNLGNLPPSP